MKAILTKRDLEEVLKRNLPNISIVEYVMRCPHCKKYHTKTLKHVVVDVDTENCQEKEIRGKKVFLCKRTKESEYTICPIVESKTKEGEVCDIIVIQ